MRQRSRLEFFGAFAGGSFAAFVAHRADRLDVTARIDEAGPDRIRVTVDGEADLVDAFEMACSLGPLDCLVRDVRRDDLGACP